jgi:crossover junction endodeoxyribonuclease RuvC
LLSVCGNNQQSLRVLLEEPSIRPKESGRSGLTIGRNHGRLEGLLVGIDAPYDLVTPQAWRRAMGLPKRTDAEKKLRKAEAVEKCRRLLPGLQLIPDGCRVPNDGIADAGLMAEHARRTMGGAV